MQKYPPLLEDHDTNGDGEEWGEAEGSASSVMDWMGRPADDRMDLGGWTCALCIVGCFFLVYSAFYGIMANLVLYLVTEWGDSNAAAANTVTTLMGTSFLFSFVGAFASDAYMGRLWGSILFGFLAFISLCLCGLSAAVLSGGEATGSRKAWMLCALYVMGLATGCMFPNVSSLGADQLRSHEAKAKLFTLVAMAVSAGQIFATTAVTYVDNQGRWVAGFWLIAGVGGAGAALVAGIACRCRQFQAGGNPFLRILQVLAAATRRRGLAAPPHPSFLHELPGRQSAIPGCQKLQHTASLRCLDKAATLRPLESAKRSRSAWQLCTVTQVEEVKCLLQVIPIGLASTCVATMAAQVNTLFEEQALVTNTALTAWLSIPPASMHVFSIGGSILTGVLHATGGTGALFWCINGGRSRKATSLQVQGVAVAVSCVNMAVAAAVEAYRRGQAQQGRVISVLWLVPQNLLVGVASNLIYSGSLNFFYSEVSDGMRTLSSSVSLLFLGAGNYLSTILVLLVDDITSRGSRPGWIPSDLNQGHLDYFYWLLAAFLASAFALYLLYSHFVYSYRHDSQHIHPKPVPILS